MIALSRMETLIRQLQGALGGRIFRTGVAPVHFAAASISDVATVSHGLGKTPTTVVVSAQDNGVTANLSAWQVMNVGAEFFQIRGKTVDGSVIGPGDVLVAWIASG